MAKDPDIPDGKHAPIRNTRAADRTKKSLPERVVEAVKPAKGTHSKKSKKNPPEKKVPEKKASKKKNPPAK
jgi:hypothetical protein